MVGLFGRMFDFDRDGKLNGFERAAEFQFFQDVIMTNEKAEENDDMSDVDAGFSEE